jgi:hypothetical protein
MLNSGLFSSKEQLHFRNWLGLSITSPVRNAAGRREDWLATGYIRRISKMPSGGAVPGAPASERMSAEGHPRPVISPVRFGVPIPVASSKPGVTG